MAGRMFDTVVVVDWSASSTPKRGADSIWSCTLDVGTDVDTDAAEPINHRTRHAARDHVVEQLTSRAGRRIFVGFDFPYGFPTGFAAAAGLDTGATPPWAAAWAHLADEIHDGPRNANDRFRVAAELNAAISDGPGPFWGAPPRRTGAHLPATKAPGFPHRARTGTLVEHRAAEVAITQPGRRPFPVWQLLGAGSVGSQALVGIPVLHHLRHHPDLAHRSVIWPFETGLVADPTGGRGNVIVHAEIWPSSIGVNHVDHPVKDARQVVALAHHLADLDADGTLGDRFAPPLDDALAERVVTEEGWILGAPPPSS